MYLRLTVPIFSQALRPVDSVWCST